MVDMSKERIPEEVQQILHNSGFDLVKPEPIAAGANGTVFEGICNEFARRKLTESDQTEGEGVPLVQEVPLVGRCVIKKSSSLWPGPKDITYDEALALEELKHPNIVEVYMNLRFVSRTEARRYFVLEYINGGTLFDRLKPTQPLFTEFEAIQMIRQMSSGLQYLHSRNIAHGDLHSANIMIKTDDSDGSVQYKLVDFGKTKVSPEADERWKLKIDLMQMTGHFIAILGKSLFQREDIKTNLRKICYDIEMNRINTIDQMINEFNKCLPEEDRRSQSSPQRGGLSCATMGLRRFRDLLRKQRDS